MDKFEIELFSKNGRSLNEHIGSMAALPPLEKAVRNASLSPAGKYLEAATAPICHHVSGKRGERVDKAVKT